MCEEDQVVRPLADELCMFDGGGAGSENSERLIADLPAVTIGAVEQVLGPAFPKSGNRRQLIGCTSCDQQSPRFEYATVGEGDREAGLDRDDPACDELDAVGGGLVTTGRKKIGGRHPVTG